jgi:hypothetical protein
MTSSDRPRLDHRTEADLVDDHGVHGLDAADDGVGDHLGLDAVFLFGAERLEDRLPGGQHLALVLVVDLEHPEGALDDDGARVRVRGLQRFVEQPVDGHARRDLREDARHARHREVAAAGGADVSGQLRLHVIDEEVAAQRGHGVLPPLRAPESLLEGRV